MSAINDNKEECLFSPSSSDDEFSEEEIEEEEIEQQPQVNNTSSSMSDLVQQTNENFHILYEQIINKPSLISFKSISFQPLILTFCCVELLRLFLFA